MRLKRSAPNEADTYPPFARGTSAGEVHRPQPNFIEGVDMSNVEPAIADPLTVTIQQLGSRIGLSRATIYRLAGAGRIRLIKVGRRSLVDWASVRDYLASRPTVSPQPAR